MKSGLSTSSFWISAVSSVVGLLVLSGVMTSEEGDSLSKAIQAAAGAVVSIATTLGYVYTRLSLKQSVVDAVIEASTTANPTQLSAAMIATEAANPKALLTGTAVDAFHAALNNAGV